MQKEQVHSKISAFFENARLTYDVFGIVPLMYGSLGLEYLTGKYLNADDVDILIPKSYVTDRWSEFRTALEANGYALVDEHEHEFEKDGISYAYAQIEELESFAGIHMSDIETFREGEVSYKLLSLPQYLKVYSASVRDGYRVNVREKKDAEKIAFINRCIENANRFYHSKPLLYQAAQSGVYGNRFEFETGSITDAMFVFLDGTPAADSIGDISAKYRYRPLVCLTEAWEKCLKRDFPEARVLKRYMMKPACRFRLDAKTILPEGFAISLFDEDAFEQHPFAHGENYASFDEFRKFGSGAIVRHEGKIVASASSFLSLDNEVELDVSTEEAYRGKGLASACVSLMLADCQAKGITVHWDAQNDTSKHLAEKFGFETECRYSVYVIPGNSD